MKIAPSSSSPFIESLLSWILHQLSQIEAFFLLDFSQLILILMIPMKPKK